MVKLLKNKAVSVSLSVLSSVALVSMVAYATSIGNAVSVTTTLDVAGATTLTSAALSTTLSVTGLSTLTGFISTASSTISSGVLNVGSGSLGVATSTPSQELGVLGGAIFHESSGTTTVIIDSAGANVGGCIQMRSTGGAMWRLYATSTSVPVTFEVGACQ